MVRRPDIQSCHEAHSLLSSYKLSETLIFPAPSPSMFTARFWLYCRSDRLIRVLIGYFLPIQLEAAWSSAFILKVIDIVSPSFVCDRSWLAASGFPWEAMYSFSFLTNAATCRESRPSSNKSLYGEIFRASISVLEVMMALTASSCFVELVR